MSEVSQHGQDRGAPGVHPDADQLSAFLEQALPAHEREEVLVHLAACKDCRDTVALTLPLFEEREQVAEFSQVAAAYVAQPAGRAAIAAPAAVPRRSLWFARWTVWAPAATALAALALLLAYLHRPPPPPPEQQAQAAAPPSPKQLPEQPGMPAPAAASRPPSAMIAPDETARAKNEPVPQMDSKQTVPASADRLGPMGQAAPAAPEERPSGNFDRQLQANQLMRAEAGVAKGSGAAAPGPTPPAPEAAPQPTLQSPPVAAPMAAPPSVAQTVTVAEAPANAIATTSENADASIALADVHGPALPGAILPERLPSRQAVLSSASYGSRMLAVDARHALFLSTDAGRHWKRVSGPWRGQAVQVELVLGSGASGMAAAIVSNERFSGLASRDRQLASAPPASLAGTVTDPSGAAIRDATITVTDTATKNTRTAVTGVDGTFSIAGLAPGNYDLKAAASGFEEMRLGGLAVDSNKQNVANLTLQVGMSAETVTVASPDVQASEREKKSAAAAPVDVLQPPAAFEITTDAGERWTSADGKTWKHD